MIVARGCREVKQFFRYLQGFLQIDGAKGMGKEDGSGFAVAEGNGFGGLLYVWAFARNIP